VKQGVPGRGWDETVHRPVSWKSHTITPPGSQQFRARSLLQASRAVAGEADLLEIIAKRKKPLTLTDVLDAIGRVRKIDAKVRRRVGQAAALPGIQESFDALPRDRQAACALLRRRSTAAPASKT
jgi:hypothetical protein